MNLMLSLSLAASLALGAQFAPQRAGSEMLEPALEARVQLLGKQLRCAVCQGVSIADSPASMARAQLDRVRELVAEGKTDVEIRDYFVARYGEWVLLEPPAHGVNLLVWLLPGAVILGGLALIIGFVKSNAGPAPTPAGGGDASAAAPPPPSSDPYLDAVRRELEK